MVGAGGGDYLGVKCHTTTPEGRRALAGEAAIPVLPSNNIQYDLERAPNKAGLVTSFSMASVPRTIGQYLVHRSVIAHDIRGIEQIAA